MKFEQLGINIYNKEVFKKNCECNGRADLIIDNNNITDDDLAIYMHEIMKNELKRNYLIYIKRTDKFDKDIIIVDNKGYFAIEKDKVAERVEWAMLRLGIIGIAGFIESSYGEATKFELIEN